MKFGTDYRYMYWKTFYSILFTFKLLAKFIILSKIMIQNTIYCFHSNVPFINLAFISAV